MKLFDLNSTSPLLKNSDKVSFSLDGFDDSDTKRELALREKQQLKEQSKSPTNKFLQSKGFGTKSEPSFIDSVIKAPTPQKVEKQAKEKEAVKSFVQNNANLNKLTPTLRNSLGDITPDQVDYYQKPNQYGANFRNVAEVLPIIKNNPKAVDTVSNIGRFLGKADQAIDRMGKRGAQFLVGDEAVPEEAIPTTGNRLVDTATDIGGFLAGAAFNPAGGGVPSMLGATNNLGNKILMKTPAKVLPYNLPGKIARGAIEGVVTTAPLTAYSSAVNQDTPEELLQRAKTDLGAGALFGGALRGAGDLIGKGLSKAKNVSSLDDMFANPYKGMSDILPSQIKPTEINMKPSTLSGRYNIKPNQAPIETPIIPIDTESVDMMDLQLFNKEYPNAGKFKASEGLPQDTRQRIVNSQTFDKKGLKDRWNNFYQEWVDSENATKKFSDAAKDKDPYIKATNSKKVGQTVSYIINEDLVNPKGNIIGESLKNIAKDIPKNKELDFWDYMLHKHNTARYNEGKPIFSDFTDTQSLDKAFQYEQNNPEFRNLGNRINRFLEKFSNSWLRDTGLTSEDLLDQLRGKYPNYIPTQREYSQLEKGVLGGNAKSGYVDQPSTIRGATGSDRNVLNPLENIMNLVNRTVRTARRNEVGQSILTALNKNPEQLRKFAEVLPNDYKGRLDLDNIVTIRENGNPVHIRINDKNFLDTITGLVDSKASKTKILDTVNKTFKGLITQYNPIFAIRNIARDIPTSYIYGSEKNPIKFGKELLSAGKDILKNDKAYKQYKALGGGSENFFAPDNVTQYKNDIMTPSKNPIKKVIKGIEKFNNLTETAPRLAEFKRSLSKGKSPQEALFNAGETTVNFSRGGQKAKAVEKFVPYFNASVQGLDRLARNIINNPLQTAGKSLVAITIPTVFQEVWNKSVDPEGYKNLDNRTKDNYFVFAQGDGKFIKIPKSRELGVLFSSLFQRIKRASEGDKEAFKSFGNTVATNFSPTNPLENNIVRPIINLKTNKDFADRDIVPRYMKDDNRSPYLQYDEKTTELAKKIGELANLSPKQIDYIIKSYSGFIGQYSIPLMQKGGNPSKALSSQFISDSTHSNQSITDFYDNIEKLKRQASDKNIIEDIPSKKVTEEERFRNIFDSASSNITKFRKEINKINSSDIPQSQKDAILREKQSELVQFTSDLNNALKEKDINKLRKLEYEFDLKIKRLGRNP